MSKENEIPKLHQLPELAEKIDIYVRNWLHYETEALRLYNKFGDKYILRCLACGISVNAKMEQAKEFRSRKKLAISKEDLEKAKEKPVIGKYKCPRCGSTSTVLTFVPKDSTVDEILKLYEKQTEKYKKLAFEIAKKLPFYQYWLRYVHGAGESIAILLSYIVLRSFARHNKFVTQAMWRMVGLVPWAYCPNCKTIVEKKWEKGMKCPKCGIEVLPVLPTKRYGIKLDFSPKIRARLLVSVETMLAKQKQCLQKNGNCGVYYVALQTQYKSLIEKGKKKLVYLFNNFEKLSDEKKQKILEAWAFRSLRVILAKILIEHASRIMAMYYGLPYALPIKRENHEIYNPLVDLSKYKIEEPNAYIDLEQSKYYLAKAKAYVS
jgi:DNA-directed RNA polymerase subunit M/transcription elongation factor TFIIS